MAVKLASPAITTSHQRSTGIAGDRRYLGSNSLIDSSAPTRDAASQRDFVRDARFRGLNRRNRFGGLAVCV
jgi:hypothetical protein